MAALSAKTPERRFTDLKKPPSEGIAVCVFFELLVAGPGFEPRSMHKQNCFQLPQAGMALPDHDYIIVRFDVANTSGAVNDARH